MFIGSRSGSPSCSLEQHALCPLSVRVFLRILVFFASFIYFSTRGFRVAVMAGVVHFPLLLAPPLRRIRLGPSERERSNTNLSPLPSHPSRSTEEDPRAVIAVTAELTTIQPSEGKQDHQRVCTQTNIHRAA